LNGKNQINLKFKKHIIFAPKYQTKLYAFCLIFFFSYPIVSQTPEQTILFADSLVSNGNFALALKNYKRAFFFSNEFEQQFLYHKIADCLYYDKKYFEALNYYDKALSTSENDSLSIELSLKKSYCFIFSKNYKHAQAELISLPNPLHKIQQQKIDLAMAVAYFAEEDYHNAQLSFKKTIPETEPALSHSVDSIFKKIHKLQHPSRILVLTSSLVFPGSGQMISGDFKNGINALTLSSVIIAAGIKVALIYSPADAIITVFPWFMRYYKGNLKSSKISAAKRKAYKKNKVLNQILDIMEKENR